MKQVTTFSGSEVLTAVSLYNKIAKEFGINGVSVIDLVKAGFTQKDDHGYTSLEVSMTGDITMTVDVDSQSVIKFMNVVSKYVTPMCGFVKGLITIFKSLEPMVSAFSTDMRRTLTYNDAAYVVRGYVSKFGESVDLKTNHVVIDFPSDLTDHLKEEIKTETAELTAEEVVKHLGEYESSLHFQVSYYVVNGNSWKVFTKL